MRESIHSTNEVVQNSSSPRLQTGPATFVTPVVNQVTKVSLGIMKPVPRVDFPKPNVDIKMPPFRPTPID